MDKKEAIKFLEKKVKEISNLGRLPHNAQSVILWRDSIEDVLEAVYGRNSTEFMRFFHTRHKKLPPNQEYTQKMYMDQLKKRKTALLSIINKEKIMGFEEKSIAKENITKTEIPIQLFDAMQFHQKIIDASRSLFNDRHYSDAIFRAFTAVCTFVKEKSGSSLDGKSLMSMVFNEDKPIIKINDLLTATDHDEQEGFKFLYMGSQVGIRNPKAHDNIVQKDPYRTLEYLSLASILIRRIEEGKKVKI